MSLFRRGNIWHYEFEREGIRFRSSTGTSDKKAAQEHYDRAKSSVWRVIRQGERPPVTWQEACAKWLKLRERGLPDRYRIRSLKIPPDTLLPLGAELLIKALPDSAPATFNRSLALVIAIHNTSKVDPPAVDAKPVPPGRLRWLTKSEWFTLLKRLEQKSPLLAQCARFSIATGLRENNVLNLRWSQVDIKRARLHIDAAEMKSRVPLGIPLTRDALKVLSERQGLDETYVFAHPDTGLPLTKASNRAWYEAISETGLKKTGVVWHTLRHTWASWAVMSGVRLEEVQKLGGWSTIQMVMRYAHLSPDHLAGAAAKIRPIESGGPHKNPHSGWLAQR